MTASRSRLADAFALETPALTVIYWGAVALFVAAFWVARMPPLIDYPQHVALGAVLHRLADPRSPERALFDVNLVTYNGGFHLVVAALSFLVRPEVAGKILLSIYPPLFATAALALVRVADRPRHYALFALPATWSFVLGWGFANYVISMPLAMLAVTWWIRWRRGERGMLVRLALASAVLAYTHVLATLMLCASIGIVALVLFRAEDDEPMRARLARLAASPLPVWPALVWCTFVFLRNRQSPHANWEGWDDGKDDPLWYKFFNFTAFSVGNFTDRSDQALLALAFAGLVMLWQTRDRVAPSHPVTRWLALGFGWLYCLVPKVFIATWFVFERFPPWAIVYAVAATPIVGARVARIARVLAAFTALAAGVNTVGHMARLPDVADCDAILDDIPAGKRVVAVTWSNHADPVVLREMWVHTLAYYQARRPGLVGYSFLKFESMPVHYQLGKRPPQLPGGIEWNAALYDADTEAGRYWDTVLVRTPNEAPDADPAPKTFGALADRAKVLSHRGRFWLYDASAFADAAPDDDAPAEP